RAVARIPRSTARDEARATALEKSARDWPRVMAMVSPPVWGPISMAWASALPEPGTKLLPEPGGDEAAGATVVVDVGAVVCAGVAGSCHIAKASMARPTTPTFLRLTLTRMPI